MVRPAIEGAAQERERRRLDLLALRGEAHVVDLAVLGEPSLVASGGVRKAGAADHDAIVGFDPFAPCLIEFTRRLAEIIRLVGRGSEAAPRWLQIRDPL